MHRFTHHRRYRRGLQHLVTVMLSALALTSLSVVFAPPPASADCPLFSTNTVDGARVPECGPGPGAVSAYGPRIGLPRPSSGAGYYGRPYGTIKAATGVTALAVVASEVRDLVVGYDVPWPKKTGKRADIPYRVYQVWFVGSKNFKMKPGPGKKDSWKYGISMKRQGETRPKKGRRNCEADARTRAGSCTWKWVRTNVIGFYRARRIEAMYAANYKRKRDRCPIGMTKCI